MKELVDFVQLQLNEIPGFEKLDSDTKSYLVVLASVVAATAVCDKFFRLLDEYKEQLK